MKRYKLYADAIVGVHALWTLIVFGGILLMLFWHAYARWEIVVVTFTLLLSLPFGTICPLTKMEERFRRKFDPSFHNDGSFVAHYGNRLLGTRFSADEVNGAI